MAGVRVTMVAMLEGVRHGRQVAPPVVLGAHATQVIVVLVSEGVESNHTSFHLLNYCYIQPRSPLLKLGPGESDTYVYLGPAGVAVWNALQRLQRTRWTDRRGNDASPVSGLLAAVCCKHVMSSLWCACHGGATFPLLTGYLLAHDV